MTSISRDAVILMALALLILLTQLTVLRKTNQINAKLTTAVEGCR